MKVRICPSQATYSIVDSSRSSNKRRYDSAGDFINTMSFRNKNEFRRRKTSSLDRAWAAKQRAKATVIWLVERVVEGFTGFTERFIGSLPFSVGFDRDR